MEKNRIRPVKSGKGIRMSYSRQKEVLGMPNLIEVQRDSYEWFLSTGLKEVLEDISPIEDYAQNLSLEFVDFKLCEDEKKYTIEECTRAPEPWPESSIAYMTGTCRAWHPPFGSRLLPHQYSPPPAYKYGHRQ